MTDEPDKDRPPSCSDHRWSQPLSVWLEDAVSQDPTKMRRVCLACEAEETITVKVGGHS